MNQAERIIKEHFQENWRKWVSTLICALLLWCITTWAQSWIVNTTKIYLASEEGQQKIFETMKDSYKNAIGASYSAHFVLGKKRNAFEHSIPIYVTDGSPTKLYLEMVQSGPDDPVKVDLSVEGFKINYDLSQSSPMTKEIDLDSYIAEAKKAGIYDFDENILTVSFRADPTQETDNIVSVKVLINVLGLPVMGR